MTKKCFFRHMEQTYVFFSIVNAMYRDNNSGAIKTVGVHFESV